MVQAPPPFCGNWKMVPPHCGDGSRFFFRRSNPFFFSGRDFLARTAPWILDRLLSLSSIFSLSWRGMVQVDVFFFKKYSCPLFFTYRAEAETLFPNRGEVVSLIDPGGCFSGEDNDSPPLSFSGCLA